MVPGGVEWVVSAGIGVSSLKGAARDMGDVPWSAAGNAAEGHNN